ncbi:MAG: aminoacyl-tRNA hydrolase [bacterium]
MKVIIGLGNPGKKYEYTRHNAGFMFVDKLREYLGWDKGYDVGDWKEEKNLKAVICEARTQDGSKILLAKPQTFMNLSGESVQKIISMYKLDTNKDMILVHDDLDIKFGQYKIQPSLSPKVHNGVNSVEQYTGKKDFLRVRMGVDSREHVKDMSGEKYVLMNMNESELQLLKVVISSAVKELRSILSL